MKYFGRYWYEVNYIERRTYDRKKIEIPADSIDHAKAQVMASGLAYSIESYTRRLDRA